MTDISLLTIVRGRRKHLHNLLRGIAGQHCPPREVVLVFMNEAIPTDLPDPGCPMYMHRLDKPDDELPLAAARNRAAAEANGETLAFLDVDCIPHPDYVSELEEAVCLTQGLIMGNIRYLSEGAADGNWTVASLEKNGVPHPRRPQLPEGEKLLDLDYPMFWSLTFGIRQKDFARLGGFDEGFKGVGAEDTDLAFTARKIGLPFYGCGARVYHQYHQTYSPPYNNMNSLIVNANYFHKKWGIWPMDGWLKKFEAEGYIDWGKNEITVLRQPDQEEMTLAKTNTPYG